MTHGSHVTEQSHKQGLRQTRAQEWNVPSRTFHKSAEERTQVFASGRMRKHIEWLVPWTIIQLQKGTAHFMDACEQILKHWKATERKEHKRFHFYNAQKKNQFTETEGREVVVRG